MESLEPSTKSETVLGPSSHQPILREPAGPSYPHHGTMCTHSKPCHREVGESFWNNFVRGCAIKLILRLITERSFRSIAKNYKDIPKFGLVVGLFSGVFKLTRCLLNRYFKDMHPRFKAFIAGVVCSFSLQLATQGE